jgi:EmrB/QacA subfamily drug resistance transporter
MAVTSLPRDASGAERSNRRRWWALVVVCLGMFMNALDASIVNVALPAIQRDLHFSQSSLIWVVDAFLITFASFLLMAGRLGDLIGRKLVFLAGIASFTVASIVCGVAVNPAMLVIGRFVQGIGGALSASVIIAIIVTEFPEPGERAKAMSAYIFVAVGGGSIGLLVGGVLTQALSWHWIFFINVPVGVATFLLGRALIHENVGLGIRNGVDVTGSIMVTLALMLGTFAIIEATQYGWVSAHTFLFGGASLLLLVGFVVLESRLANPILPLRILRVSTLVNSSLLRAFLMAGLSTTLFLGVLYLENVLGYSPIRTGLGFLPISLVMGLMSVGITARLVARFGAKRVLVPGMASATAGLLLLTRIGPGSSFTTVVLPAFILLGFGAGTSFMPLLSIAMTDVPNADAGLGSGIVNVSMQMAGALGLAVLGTLATEHSKSLEAAGHATADALSSGFRLSFLVAAVFVGVGTVLAVIILKEVPVVQRDPESLRQLEIENAGEPLAT